MDILNILLVIVIVGLVIVAVSSLIDNNVIKKRCYTIKDSRIKKDLRFVFLSDLHGNSFGNDNVRLIEDIKAVNPDFILIGGDMITAKTNKMGEGYWNNALKLFEGLSDYKLIYGIGNHEYRMDLYREDFKNAFDRYSECLKKRNIQILYNESEMLDDYNIKVSGLAIDRRFYKRFEKNEMTLEYLKECLGSREDAFTIMLAHNPEYCDIYSKYADLTLSGHVHGGIAKLPVLGGVISPRLTLFPKYDGGYFKENNAHMIISRGLGSHTLPFRVFNPCELVIIDLKKI